MFEEVMNFGPIAREQCINLKVYLNDASLHEDSIHRGPAQIIPAVRDGLKEAFKEAKPTMLEPVQEIDVNRMYIPV